jgi:hypothetical protein
LFDSNPRFHDCRQRTNHWCEETNHQSSSGGDAENLESACDRRRSLVRANDPRMDECNARKQT